MIEIFYSDNIMLTGIPAVVDTSFDHEKGTQRETVLEVFNFKIYCVDESCAYEITSLVQKQAPERFYKYQSYFLNHDLCKAS